VTSPIVIPVFEFTAGPDSVVNNDAAAAINRAIAAANEACTVAVSAYNKAAAVADKVKRRQ
jgi:hypothetical protein